MKELLITQPDFMETFRCAGTACREHCCKNQHVILDRNRYQKYIKSPFLDIKRIAITEISVTQTSLAAWANIIPDSRGNCPFLDEQQLCQIYKHIGANALSNSCASYPQVDHVYKNQKIKSMSLSCPEVTRQVFFSPNALTLRFSTINQYDYYKAPDIVTEERLVNRACAAITAACSHESIEENLWAISHFLQTHQISHDASKNKMVEIDHLRAELIATVESGKAALEFIEVDFDPLIRHELVGYLRDFITQLPDVRGKKVLATYVYTLLDTPTNKLADHNLKYRCQQQIWSSAIDHNLVFRHYFLYRIHHDQLAMGSMSATTMFNLQLIDYFYLKLLISTHVVKNGQFIEDDVIDIVYSYHACRESTDRASQQFIQQLTALAMREDFSIFSLLA